MKFVDKADATATPAEYTGELANDTVIVTSEGRPVAALVPIENVDLETVLLSTNREFLQLIERARARVRDGGGISSKEMHCRFE